MKAAELRDGVLWTAEFFLRQGIAHELAHEKAGQGRFLALSLFFIAIKSRMKEVGIRKTD